MKKLLTRFLKKYVRVFPHYDRAVICRFAGGCTRGCPCSEHEKKAYVFKFICNYGNNVRSPNNGLCSDTIFECKFERGEWLVLTDNEAVKQADEDEDT